MNATNEPNKLQAFWAKTEPFRNAMRKIGNWIYRLRGLLMAVPVALAALWMAAYNTVNLPEEVGLIIMETGQYQWTVARGTAVLIPVAVTGVCLLLTFLSRRTVYPWLISIFSLILPILIYVTNIFPA